jgi:hypothetical protein
MKRIIAAFAIAMMVCGSAAWADSARPIVEEFDAQFFDAPIIDCNDYGLGFWILADATFHFKQTSFFDRDGNLLRIRVRWTLDDGVYKNSLDPSRQIGLEPGWGANQWIDVYSGETVQTGAYTRVVVPGRGPLYFSAGRLVIAGDGTITFQAGKLAWDSEAELCAYMAN